MRDYLSMAEVWHGWRVYRDAVRSGHVPGDSLARALRYWLLMVGCFWEAEDVE